MASNSKSTISDSLYPIIDKSLKNKDVLSSYKSNLDNYLSYNTESYFGPGPGNVRPIYSDKRIEQYINLLGTSSKEVDTVIKSSKNVNSSWFMLKPYNVVNCLALKHFLDSKNQDYITLTVGYLIVAIYPPLHWRYFKHGVNEACMQYTLNNLSNKYIVTKSNNLWAMLMDTCMKAVELHADNIKLGTDAAIIKYLNDVQSRINSSLKNIANVYYDNHKNQRYLKTEHESFEDATYYEADSNSYAIERITNKVVTHLVTNGPDAKLVELSAKLNKVSINQLRNFVDVMIVDSHTEEIRDIVEAILFLYLFNTDGENHSPDQIGTNDFMVYCLQIYRRSNTTDKNIIKIKAILDRWLKELGLMDKTSRTATIVSFRKALFTFFVMEIQKIA